MAHKRIDIRFNGFPQEAFEFFEQLRLCLLYTSDAADE